MNSTSDKLKLPLLGVGSSIRSIPELSNVERLLCWVEDMDGWAYGHLGIKVPTSVRTGEQNLGTNQVRKPEGQSERRV